LLLINAIAIPTAHVLSGQTRCCDEQQNNGDEQFWKSAEQDDYEKRVKAACHARQAFDGRDTFIFGKLSRESYALWKL